MKLEYQSIYAYKSKNASLNITVFIIYFLLCAFFVFVCFSSLYSLIGVAITAVIWIWYLVKYIKYKLTPDFVLTQINENLYIFPDTNEQITIPLKEVVEIKKKHYHSRYGNKLPDGNLIIITKTDAFKLSVSNLDTHFSRLENNLQLFKNSAYFN